MSDIAKIRIRWFRAMDSPLHPLQGDLDAEALRVVGGHPARMATVESDGGNGPIHLISIGGAGVIWSSEGADAGGDCVVREWEAEDAAEEIGSVSALDLLLSEFHEAFREEGITYPRIVTAETNRPGGDLIVLDVSYFDPNDGLADDEF